MTPDPLKPDSLTWGTRQGVFLADDGVRFWVLESFNGQYAVRLDGSSDYSQFMAHHLGSSPLATGVLLRRIQLKRGPAVEKRFQGRCGIVGTSGLRLFIKVIDEAGNSKRLVLLPDVLREHCRYTTFFPNWSLHLSVGPGFVPVFESASEPPRIRVPQVNLSAPAPNWSSPSAYLPENTKR